MGNIDDQHRNTKMNDNHHLVGHLIDHCGCLARPWDTWVLVVCMHSWWVCSALHPCLVELQWPCTPLWWANMCLPLSYQRGRLCAGTGSHGWWCAHLCGGAAPAVHITVVGFLRALLWATAASWPWSGTQLVGMLQ